MMMMMMMMSCLSVMLVYCGRTVAYFSYCSAELLFIDLRVQYRTVFASSASASHGKKEEATASCASEGIRAPSLSVCSLRL